MKSDIPTKAIVAALREVGCSVTHIDAGMYSKGTPDLLVGRAGVTYLIEVKNKDGRNRFTPSQVKWWAEWKGQTPHVVTGVAEALIVVGLVP